MAAVGASRPRTFVTVRPVGRVGRDGAMSREPFGSLGHLDKCCRHGGQYTTTIASRGPLQMSRRYPGLEQGVRTPGTVTPAALALIMTLVPGAPVGVAQAGSESLGSDIRRNGTPTGTPGASQGPINSGFPFRSGCRAATSFLYLGKSVGPICLLPPMVTLRTS